MQQNKRPFGLYALLLVAVVLSDQALKYWVRLHIPLQETKPFLPHIVEFTYVKNTGAAFSMLSNHTGLLTGISLLAVVLLTTLLIRKDFFPTAIEQWATVLILAGAIGNLIDRAYLGYVVDMFSLQFMDFAIFNIADMAVCVGGALLFLGIFLTEIKSKREKQS